MVWQGLAKELMWHRVYSSATHRHCLGFRASTYVFYHHISAVLGPRSTQVIYIQYKVNRKLVIHDANALHLLEFHILEAIPITHNFYS